MRINRIEGSKTSAKIKSDIMLLIAAVIWGSAFVAQKAGAVLEPFTYNGIRTLIGGLVLLPAIYLFEKRGNKGAEITDADKKASDRTAIKGGICCGLILCLASNLQQFGMYFAADAGKAGFITSLYIVFVPALALFLGKRSKPVVWACVGLGVFGFYLLTMAGNGGAALQKGDFYVLLCSFVFAAHILAVDHFAPKCNGLKLSCVQFFTTGVISAVLMLIFESPSITAILDCWLPILYCGVLSSGVAYTLQVLGQKNAEPAAATLIMSLESVFAVLFGCLIAGERLTLIEGIGCAVIFTAVLIPQLFVSEGR